MNADKLFNRIAEYVEAVVEYKREREMDRYATAYFVIVAGDDLLKALKELEQELEDLKRQ